MANLYDSQDKDEQKIAGVPISGEDNSTLDERKAFESRMRQSKQWWQVVVDEVLEKVGERPRSAMGGAYIVRPKSRFITQQEDEEIVLLLRAHPFTNIGWILLALLMLALPGVIDAFGILSTVPVKFIFVGKLVWYLMVMMYVFEKFLYWYYSVFIVTNERLVDIDFVNLLWREVTYANLNHIEEPEMITGGFIRSLFQYGNVYVTTASEKPSLEALAVPWPQRVVDVISRLAEELEKRRERGE
jgi:membrane protein YdbS with pleckstrin-like domain